MFTWQCANDLRHFTAVINSQCWYASSWVWFCYCCNETPNIYVTDFSENANSEQNSDTEYAVAIMDFIPSHRGFFHVNTCMDVQ